jgi:hypothetical protein
VRTGTEHTEEGEEESGHCEEVKLMTILLNIRALLNNYYVLV